MVVATGGVLLIAACGGDGDTTDTGGQSATEPPATESTTTEDTPESTTSPTAAPTTEDTPDVTTTIEATTTSGAPATDAVTEITCTETSVDSGGTPIPGERCEPTEPAPGPLPAAIVLNGCGGYESDDEITSATVRALAERGLVALRIDWLAAEPAPPDTYCAPGPVIAAVQPLLQAVVDGVASLRADPMVDPARIGSASYSLGAIGAMAAELGGAGLTSVEPLGLSAAALLSYPNQLPTIPAAAEAGDVPPLFLMTGELDIVAPPADAQVLADAATVGGVPSDVVIVPGQQHPWRGDAALVAAAALADFLAGALSS